MRNHRLLESLRPMGTTLKRKSFFVDESILRQAKKVLGVKTDAEAIRMSVERIVEMEEFWKFMNKSRHTLKPGSLEEPE
jgi:hypothetical protein